MEDPPREISQIIHLLTQSPPSLQRTTIERYFTPNASFSHPFCRTGSFEGSRYLIWCIYRWYKILSPRIDLQIDSIAYDPSNQILYISLHQIFSMMLLPRRLYSPTVKLTSVLTLARVPGLVYTESSRPRFFIKRQEDLYQVGEFVKFVSLFGGLRVLVAVAQFVATGLCVLGAWAGWPVSWVEENVLSSGRRMGKVGDESR